MGAISLPSLGTVSFPSMWAVSALAGYQAFLWREGEGRLLPRPQHLQLDPLLTLLCDLDLLLSCLPWLSRC